MSSVFVVVEKCRTYYVHSDFVLGIYNDRKLAVKAAKKHAKAHEYVLAFVLAPKVNPGDEWEKEPVGKDEGWSTIRIVEIKADCPCVRISLEEKI